MRLMLAAAFLALAVVAGSVLVTALQDAGAGVTSLLHLVKGQ